MNNRDRERLVRRESKRTEVSAFEFGELFDIADELYGSGGLTLYDLDEAYVIRGKKTAELLDVAWPPYLPEMEELALRKKFT